MNNQQILASKRDLNQVCNMPGWRVVLDILNEAMKESQERLLACKNRDDRDDLFCKAQASKELIDDFQKRIQAMRNVETTSLQAEESFISVIAD